VRRKIGKNEEKAGEGSLGLVFILNRNYLTRKGI